MAALKAQVPRLQSERGKTSKTAKLSVSGPETAGSPATWPPTWRRRSGPDLRDTKLRFWAQLDEFSNPPQMQNPSLSLTDVWLSFRKDRDEIRSPKV